MPSTYHITNGRITPDSGTGSDSNEEEELPRSCTPPLSSASTSTQHSLALITPPRSQGIDRCAILSSGFEEAADSKDVLEIDNAATVTSVDLHVDYVLEALRQFNITVRQTWQRKVAGNENHSYEDILVLPISVEVFHKFCDRYRFHPLLVNAKVQYYNGELRISGMGAPLPHHDISQTTLKDNGDLLVMNNLLTTAETQTWEFGNSMFFNSDYTQIVPDGQVLVSNHIDGVWPAIIIEVANSQTYNKVLAKMQLWFVTSQAVVRAVCIIRYPQDALVTSTVHVELWRCFSRSSDLVTTVCNNAGTVNTGIRYIPPPQEIDIAENFAAMQEALDQAKPGQLLFTYREGPIYWLYEDGFNTHAQIPLTYEDWFGRVTGSHPGPGVPGITPQTTIPIYSLAIRNAINRGLERYRRLLDWARAGSVPHPDALPNMGVLGSPPRFSRAPQIPPR